MKTIPKSLLQLLQSHDMGEMEIIDWIVCDRKLRGGPAETYVVLTEKELLIASPGKSNERDASSGIHKLRQFDKFRDVQSIDDSDDLDNNRLEMIPIESIEEISIVSLVASGLVVLNIDGEKRIIGAFTNGHSGRASAFASIFSKIKKKEALTDRDYEQKETEKSCPNCGRMYPDASRKICPKCMNKRAIFTRLLSYATDYKALIFFIVLFMLLNSATGLVIPYLQGTVFFDQALGGTGTFAGQILLVVSMIVLFRTVSLIFGVSFGILNAKLAANVAFDLKARIFTAMQRLSLQFYQKKQTGQLMTRVNNDATELQYFFVDGIPYFILNALNIFGILTILLVMDWKLTLLALIPLPIVLGVVRTTFPKLWRLAGRRHARASTMNAFISDTITGSRVVKTFGKETRETERFQRTNVAYADVEQTFNKLAGTFIPILTLLTQIGGLIIWVVGGMMVLHQNMEFGKLMTFVGYIYMLFGPIQFMNNIVNWWSYCMSAAQRIFEIQDAVPDVAEKKDAISLDQMEGSIVVDNITFGYEPNKSVLKNVSLEAKPGQMIGIVGHSGAGKSTLVNVISRLYDVSGGDILLDGVSVKDLTFDTMRKHIGIVSQEVYVFMGTIAENIAYAKPDCTLGEIIRAAKIANAHDFIEKLPDGYDTITGTGGHSLSGGEKQRISIARAILHNPKILILDEATASLDTETELQIQEALEALMEGRTTIAIAHRLSTLRNADVLVVMDNGKVVEQGSHEQLMDQNGEYAKLVRKHDEALQMKGVG